MLLFVAFPPWPSPYPYMAGHLRCRLRGTALGTPLHATAMLEEQEEVASCARPAGGPQ